MSSIAERYGIVFDAAVEIDRVSLKNNQQVYAETARQLENSPAVRQVEQSATALGDRAGRQMNEALAARVRGAAGILRAELNKGLGEGGTIDIDPRFDRAKFQAGVAQLTAGMDDVVDGNLTKGLHAAVARQVRAGFLAGMAQAGKVAPVMVDVQLTGSIQDELLKLQQGALSKIGIDAEIRNLPRLQQQLSGLMIDADLTPQARRALQAIETLGLGRAQTLRINVQEDEKLNRLLRGMNAVVNITVNADGLDFTALYRESATAGRQAAIAASTAFRRQFNTALNSMRFRVRVDAQIGRVLTPSGRPPIINTVGRTLPAAQTPRALPAARPATTRTLSDYARHERTRPSVARTRYGQPRELPEFDPNPPRKFPQQSRSAVSPTSKPIPAAPAPQQPASAPYVPYRRQLPQAHYALRAGWAEEARNKSADAPRILGSRDKLKAGYLPVRSARGVQEVNAREYLDSISDLGADRQGRVLTTMSGDEVKRGKRYTKPGEHRQPVALQNRPGNRVTTFFTTGKHLGPDGTTYASSAVKPVLERDVAIYPRKGVNVEDMQLLPTGSEIAPGTTRQLAKGSYAQYQAGKRDVPFMVRGYEDITSEKGDVIGKRALLASRDDVGFDRAVLDYKNLASKGAILQADFGRDLTIRGANNKFTGKPDFIAEGKDAGAMALRYWQAHSPDERRELLKSVKGVKGLTADKIETIATSSARNLKYHAEELYPAFNELAPRYRATADLWQNVTEQSAADYFVQDYYGEGKRDRTYDPRARRAALARARREGRLGSSDVDGLVRARMTSEGLMIPQVATISEDFEPRKRWISRENLDAIRRHNPDLADRITSKSQATRRAYGAMVNVQHANQKLSTGFDVDLGTSGRVLKANEIDWVDVNARTRDYLATDFGLDDVTKLPERSAIDPQRYNNARNEALRSLYGSAEYLEVDMGGQRRYLPGPTAMQRFGESGEALGLDGNATFDKRSTALAGGVSDVMDQLERGSRGPGMDTAFGRYWAAQDEIVTGSEFAKRSQGYFLKDGDMTGHTLRVSAALQDNEVYVPGWEGGAAAVGRAPYMFNEANAGGLRVLSKEEWIARGGNVNESGISARMATVLGGDTDGDKVSFLRDYGGVSDPAIVRAAVEEQAKRRVRYGANDQVKAPFGIAKRTDLEGSLLSPLTFDHQQVAADMARFNNLQDKIGNAYNTTNNKLRASAGRGGLKGAEAEFVDTLHASTYSTTQIPKALPPELATVMTTLGGSYEGSGRQPGFDLKGRRYQMMRSLLDSGKFGTSDLVNLSAGFTRSDTGRARLQGAMQTYLQGGDAGALRQVVDGMDVAEFAQQSVVGRAMLGQATQARLDEIEGTQGSAFSRKDAIAKMRLTDEVGVLTEGMNDSDIERLLDRRTASTGTTQKRSTASVARLKESNQAWANAMLMGTLPGNVDFRLIEDPKGITNAAKDQLIRNNRLVNAAGYLGAGHEATPVLDELRAYTSNSAQRYTSERNLSDMVRRGALPDEALAELLPLLPADVQKDLSGRGIKATEGQMFDRDRVRLRAVEELAASGASVTDIEAEARSVKHTDLDDTARITAGMAVDAEGAQAQVKQNAASLEDTMDTVFEDVNDATVHAKEVSDQALHDAEAAMGSTPTGGGRSGGGGAGAPPPGGSIPPGDRGGDEWWERVRRQNRSELTNSIEDVFERTDLRRSAYGELSTRDAFKRFAGDRPDLANMLYEEGIRADRSGTLRNEGYRAGYAQDLDRIVATDAKAIGLEGEHSQAVEQFRARRQMYADRARGMAEFRSFLDDDSFTFSQDPMRNEQERAIARRMKGMASEEQLTAIRRGDHKAYQNVSGRARRLTQLRGMGSAMLANAGGFALASVGMAAFTRVAQQVGEYEKSLKSAEAMINLNREMQGVDAEAFTNQAGRAGRGIGASRSEMIELARAYSAEGGDAERAVEITQEMGGLVRATGESVQELSGYLAASEKAGFRDPQEIAEYAVARGVSLAEIGKAVNALGPGLQGLSDDERAAAIVGYDESEGIKLSQNDAIRRRQMERLIDVGESSEAFADTEKGMGSFQKAIGELGAQVMQVWESLKPGLSILAEMASMFLKVTNTVLSFVSALPGADVVMSMGMLAASVAAISGAWKGMMAHNVFRTAIDGTKMAGAAIFNQVRGVGAGLGRAGARGWQAMGGTQWAQQGANWARGMGQQAATAANQPMYFIPPYMQAGMGGTGRSAAHAARRMRRQATVATGRVAQTVSKAGWGAGAAQVGRGALAMGGRALAMGSMLLNPVTLGLLAAGTVGIGAYRTVRNRRRQSRFEQLRSSGASEQDLARAYSGELTKEMEKAGYTVEEVRKIIDDASESGSRGISRMADEAKELARQYQGVKKAVEDFGESYERYFKDAQSRITEAGGQTVLGPNNPLLDMFGGGEGGAYDEVRDQSGNLFMSRVRAAPAEVNVRMKNWLDSMSYMDDIFRWVDNVQTPDLRDGRVGPIDVRTEAQRRSDSDALSARREERADFNALAESLRNYEQRTGENLPDVTGIAGFTNNMLASMGLRGSVANQASLIALENPEAIAMAAAFEAETLARQGLAKDIIDAEVEGQDGRRAQNRRRNQLEGLSLDDLLARGDVDPRNIQLLREREAAIRQARNQTIDASFERNARLAGVNTRLGVTDVAGRVGAIRDLITGDRDLDSIGQVDSAALEAQLQAERDNLSNQTLKLGLSPDQFASLEMAADGTIKANEENAALLDEFGYSVDEANQAVAGWSGDVLNSAERIRELSDRISKMKIDEMFQDAFQEQMAAGEFNPFAFLLGDQAMPGSNRNLEELVFQQSAAGNFRGVEHPWLNRSGRLNDTGRSALGQIGLGLDNASTSASELERRLQSGEDPESILRDVVGEGFDPSLYADYGRLYGAEGPEVFDSALRMYLNTTGMGDVLTQADETRLQDLEAENQRTLEERQRLLEAGPRDLVGASSEELRLRDSEVERAQQEEAIRARYATQYTALVREYAPRDVNGDPMTVQGERYGYRVQDFANPADMVDPAGYQAEVLGMLAAEAQELENLTNQGIRVNSETSLSELQGNLEAETAALNTADTVDRELARYQDFLERNRDALDDTVETDLEERIEVLERRRAEIRRQAETSLREFSESTADITNQMMGVTTGGGEAEQILQLARQYAGNPNLNAEQRARIGVTDDPNNPFAEGGRLQRMFLAQDTYQQSFNQMLDDFTPTMQAIERAQAGRQAPGEGSLEAQLGRLEQEGGTLAGFADDYIERLVEERAQALIATAEAQDESLTREDATALAREDIDETPIGRFLATLPDMEDTLLQQRRGMRGGYDDLNRYLTGDVTVRGARDRLQTLRQQIEDSSLDEENPLRQRLEGLADELAANAGSIDEAEEIFQQAQVDTEGMSRTEAFDVQNDALDRAVALLRERGVAEETINAIFGARLRQYEQEEEQLERVNEQFARRISQEMGLRSLRAREASLGGTLATQNQVGVQREQIRLARDLQQIENQRDNRVAAAEERGATKEWDDAQVAAEIAAADAEVKLATAERQEAFRQTMTQQAVQLSSGGLGQFETLADRAAALDAIDATGVVNDADWRLLQPQIDAIRAGAESDFGVELSKAQRLMARGEGVGAEAVTRLTTGFAEADPALQQLTGQVVNQAIEQAPALKALRDERAGDAFETLSERIERTADQIEVLENLGADQEGLREDELRQLRQSQGELEAQRRIRDEISGPAEQARRRLDRFEGSREERVAALGDYQSELADLIRGETGLTPEELLGLDPQALEELDNQTEGGKDALLQLAQAFEQANDQATQLTVAMNQLAEGMAASSAQARLEDAQRRGVNADELDRDFASLLGAQRGIVTGRLREGFTVEDAIKAARTGNVEQLQAMAVVREGENPQIAGEYLQQNAMSLFNTSHQRVSAVLGRTQEDLSRQARGTFSSGALSAEDAVAAMLGIDAQMLARIAELDDGSIDMDPYREWVRSGEASRQFAERFIQQDFEAGSTAAQGLARRGDFSGASASAAANMERIETLIQGVLDARGIDLDVDGSRPEVMATLLQNAGFGGLANTLLTGQASKEAVRTSRAQTQVQRLQGRFENNRPLFESPLNMLDFERNQLQATNQMLESSGYVRFGDDGEIDRGASNEAMVEVWEENMARIKQITEDRFLAIQKIFHDLASGMVSDLRNTVVEGIGTLLTEGLFGGRDRERQELDTEFRREAEFAESELERAKSRKEQIEQDLKEVTDPDDRRELEAQYESVIDTIEEYEGRVREINHQWDVQADKIKSVGELLADMLANLGEKFIDRLVGSVVDVAFGSIFGAGNGTGGGGLNLGKLFGSVSTGPGVSGLPAAADANRSLTYDDPMSVQLDNQKAAANNMVAAQSLSSGLSAFGVASQQGGGLVGGLVAGGGSLAMSAMMTGTMVNPVAAAAVAVGAALGEVVRTTRWWNEKLRTEAQGTISGINRMGIEKGRRGVVVGATEVDPDSDLYAGSVQRDGPTINVQVNNADLSSYAASRELGRRIQTESRRTAQKAGLKGS